MAETLPPRKLQTVMKSVACPNCRYKFKTPRVAVCHSGSIEESSISAHTTPPLPQLREPSKSKPLSLLLDLEIESEKGFLRQDYFISPESLEKNKSPLSSRKESLAIGERRASVTSRKSNVKSPANLQMPSIRISTEESNLRKSTKQIAATLKTFLDKSVQCSQLSSSCESPKLFPSKSRSKQKSRQMQRSRVRETLDLNLENRIKRSNSYIIEHQSKSALFTCQIRREDYESGPSYFAIKMLQKQSSEVAETMREIIKYYKREPLLFHPLPSYIKAMVLPYFN